MDITGLSVKTIDTVGASLVNSIGNSAVEGLTADNFRKTMNGVKSQIDSRFLVGITNFGMKNR